MTNAVASPNSGPRATSIEDLPAYPVSVNGSMSTRQKKITMLDYKSLPTGSKLGSGTHRLRNIIGSEVSPTARGHLDPSSKTAAASSAAFPKPGTAANLRETLMSSERMRFRVSGKYHEAAAQLKSISSGVATLA